MITSPNQLVDRRDTSSCETRELCVLPSEERGRRQYSGSVGPQLFQILAGSATFVLVAFSPSAKELGALKEASGKGKAND